MEGHTWVFLAAKFHSKSYLQALPPRDWQVYADFLLGEKVYQIRPGDEVRMLEAGLPLGSR
eukprot:3572284-Amphidinium_carterae.4